MPPEIIDRLAALMHENYRHNASTNRWPLKPELDLPFAELSPDLQEANRAAARRIGEVLAVGGIQILPANQAHMQALSEVQLNDLVEQHMRQLAPAEHEGWLQQRLEAGWKYAAVRDDAQKLHPCIVPFAELSGADKEKDRNQVRSYPALLRQAGLVGVKG